MDLSRHSTPEWKWENPDLSQGDLELSDRIAMRRVVGLSTELEDISEVEYRALRLEKVVLVGVWSHVDRVAAEYNMTELAQLAKTAGSVVLDAVIQRRDDPDPSTYIGVGKAEEVRDIVRAVQADTVICDGELTGAQLTALEKIVKVKVIDRTALILDIFAQHAVSKEGKAQVALAQMQYMLPRLRGWGESMSRQAGGRGGAGGVGLRGPGETKIETDRRRIRDRMAKLRHEIREMKMARDVKRISRNQGFTPRIAIVGYTNAGKSSLLNRMSGAGVLVENALFATLDPTTRQATLSTGVNVVFTDTVGFVSHLPHQLVDAFSSTLEEILEADLIIHLVDGAASSPERQIVTVREVLDDLTTRTGEILPPEILVFNKCDQISAEDILILRNLYPEGILVSVFSGKGMDELMEKITQMISDQFIPISVTIPFQKGELVEMINRHGIVTKQEYTEQGTQIIARIPRILAAKFSSEFAH